MYAIRQKSTGFFLPQFGKNQSKGGTWLEPAAGVMPRLFRREQDAKGALRSWLKGRLTHINTYNYGCECEDYIEKWEPAPDRKAEDMEIVPVQLVIEDRL